MDSWSCSSDHPFEQPTLSHLVELLHQAQKYKQSQAGNIIVNSLALPMKQLHVYIYTDQEPTQHNT